MNTQSTWEIVNEHTGLCLEVDKSKTRWVKVEDVKQLLTQTRKRLGKEHTGMRIFETIIINELESQDSLDN